MTPGDQRIAYRIRVGGHIDKRHAEVLGGLSIIHEPEGTTMLVGPLADQAALYGIIVSLRDMGLELLDVQRVGPDVPSEGADFSPPIE